MFSDNTSHVGGSESKKKPFSFENVDTQCLQTEQSRPSFEIFKDESVLHEQRENGTSCAPQCARRVENYKISRNEVAGMGQMQKGSGSMLDLAQQGLVFRDSIHTLSSVKRDIKISEQIEASNENGLSSYFREDNIAPYSATDELQCPQICTGKCKDAVIIKLFLATTSRPLDSPFSCGESLECTRVFSA
jgi:hypothetical protein